MNSDKDFANKLRAVLEEAQARAEREYPGKKDYQNSYIVGWMQGEAGIEMNTESV